MHGFPVLMAPQDVRCGRATLRAQKVDPLLRGGDLHHLHRRAERLRHGAGGGRRSGECPAGPERLSREAERGERRRRCRLSEQPREDVPPRALWRRRRGSLLIRR